MELWFGPILVGRLDDVFVSDDTWYGVIDIAIREPLGDAERALLAFITFCVDWNERQHEADPPGADEFDRYADLISGGWSVRSGSGAPRPIDDAPVFFRDGEVTWREPE